MKKPKRKIKNTKNKKIGAPYRKGFFKVTDGHRLYFEFYGNPQGVPVVFLHGGPGGGFSNRHKKLFDPKLYNVLFFDQRGAGRSQPFAGLKANTTAKLVQDTQALMDFAGFQKAILCGGSWGATLAFVFAIQNPERVFGMVLRSSFLANRSAVAHYIEGQIQSFYPDVWHRFIGMVPAKYRHAPLRYYYQKMKSKNRATRELYAYEWARYEIAIAPLQKPNEKQIAKIIKNMPYVSLGTLEAHYIQANCFLPENYILKNLHKIAHLPVHLSHGQYDLICPPEHAHLLHAGLPRSTLKLFVEGHYIKSAAFARHTKKSLKKLALLWRKTKTRS